MEEFTGLTGPMKASLGRGHTSQEWKRVHGFPFLVSLESLTCPGENSLGGGGTVSLAWLSRNSPAPPPFFCQLEKRGLQVLQPVSPGPV